MTLIPTEEQRNAIGVWRLMVIILAAALVVSMGINGYMVLATTRNSDDEKRVERCRSELTTEYFDALAEVMVSVGVSIEVLPPEGSDQELAASLRVLVQAARTRAAYDADPNGPCPSATDG